MAGCSVYRQRYLRDAGWLRALCSQPIRLGLLGGLAAGYALTEGLGQGSDWVLFWQWSRGTFVQGVWNPDWGKLILLPLSFYPPAVGHFAVNLVTCLVVPGWALLVKTTHSTLWYGNLDGLVLVGLLLARHSNPYLGGVGLFLMSLKPQFMPLALFHLRDSRRLIIPLSLFLLSLLAFGNWLPGWLSLMPPAPDFRVSVSLYPYSLFLWGFVFFAKKKELFVFSATALTMPYFNSLSLLVLFAFDLPTWLKISVVVLSWLNGGTAIALLVLLYAMEGYESFNYR